MIESVKGARDLLPEEIGRWQFVEDSAREVFRLYGFREIRTPIFESTELFTRSIGEGTDIVSKEMYTFKDRKGRSLTLRPENTAPVVRAYLQHQLHRRTEVAKLYYIGPMFRYERPQKGRMRQFNQIGVEVLGSDHPAIDAEALETLMALLARLGIAGPQLSLNSVGCPICRPGYRQALVRYLEPLRDTLCEDCRRRLVDNPLRCFDCKVPADRQTMARAPSIKDYLCQACRDHFARVLSYLDRLSITYAVDPHLVRGLDYYCRTAFEVCLQGLGAQNALLGGGRYDGLAEALGGPSVPGFGFAVGEDRLVMSLPESVPVPADSPEIIVVALGEEAIEQALVVARRLRRQGRRVVFDPSPGKSLKAQMRHANDASAPFVLILGEQEIARGVLTLKRMSDGAQETIGENDLESKLQEMARA
jgi:histidyl-tRNA synthetase